MEKIKFLELYAGSGGMGDIARALGYEVFSIDWEDYENVDLQMDIAKLKISDLPWIPDIVHMSPDCTTYSIAAISTHRNKHDRSGKTEYAKQCDATNLHTQNLLKELLILNPNLVYYIENPRGGMRKMDFMDYYPIRHTVWYCQYGDDRAKPTDIWTNNKGWIPRPMCHNKKKDKDGNVIHHCHHESAPRGSKTGTQGKNLSYERSKIPLQLCAEILISPRMPVDKKEGVLF